MKAIDLASGSLTLSSIEILRLVEGLEKRECGFILSKGQIQNIQVILAKYANRIIPYTIMQTEKGECVIFDIK